MIQFLILFVTVTILCAKNWNNFNTFNWKEPSKESLLFLWLIVLSIIPFGNCEVFGFKFNSNGNLVYGRIVQQNKRDRATSLMYGLSVVWEYEKQGKADMYKKEVDPLTYLKKYIY